MSVFTINQIQRFRREATALKKGKSISYGKNLDFIAKREKFHNWAMLMKAFNSQPLQSKDSNLNKQELLKMKPTDSNLNKQELLKICLNFIEDLEDAQVSTLCWSGSLWIDREDSLSGQVTVDSLYAMGSASDGAICQYGASLGAVLLTDFDGIADHFIFEDDEDDFGNQPVPSHDQVIYTPVVGRQVLLSCLSTNLEGDFDSLMARLEPVPVDD